MCNQYLLGNVIRLNASFTNIDGVPTSPSIVTLKIKKPDLTVETVTPANDSVGQYHYDYTPDIAGPYYYVFNGTGTLVAVSQGQFEGIEPSV